MASQTFKPASFRLKNPNRLLPPRPCPPRKTPVASPSTEDASVFTFTPNTTLPPPPPPPPPQSDHVPTGIRIAGIDNPYGIGSQVANHPTGSSEKVGIAKAVIGNVPSVAPHLNVQRVAPSPPTTTESFGGFNNPMMKQKDPTPILGLRDDSFKALIKSLLAKSGLKQLFISLLTDDEGMKTYEQVFTHKSIDAEANYEYFEILGDLTINKFLVSYFSERFPKLKSCRGVKVLAQLRIKYGSKILLAPVAEKYQFTRFISATKGEFEVSKTSLLEDVFEAFFGATENMIDTRIKQFTGYAACYSILKQFYDEMPIDASYEALHPPISRLKELFDKMEVVAKLGCVSDKQKVKYNTVVDEASAGVYVTEVSYCSNHSGKVILAVGKGPSKVASENKTAALALVHLRAQGINDDDKAKLYVFE